MSSIPIESVPAEGGGLVSVTPIENVRGKAAAR